MSSEEKMGNKNGFEEKKIEPENPNISRALESFEALLKDIIWSEENLSKDMIKEIVAMVKTLIDNKNNIPPYYVSRFSKHIEQLNGIMCDENEVRNALTDLFKTTRNLMKKELNI
jgi:hypothetical protein